MTGKPQPKVKWLRDGEEILASEEYQIENFEDGTSILVINHVYPDDYGTISFEAYNPLGVAVTTAEFAVEGIVFINRHSNISAFFDLINPMFLKFFQVIKCKDPFLLIPKKFKTQHFTFQDNTNFQIF